MDDSLIKSLLAGMAGGLDDGPTEEELSKLRRVARYQRGALFGLFANIAILLPGFWLPPDIPMAKVAFVVCVCLGACFFLGSVFLLGREVTSLGMALANVALMFVPCVSIVALLMLSHKATTLLAAYGHKVGFFGVNPRTI